MPYTARYLNFSITTYKPLSIAHENILVNAVLKGQFAVEEAKRRTLEALSVLTRYGNDCALLPPTFLQHVKTLLRCDTDGQTLKALLEAGAALNVLGKGLNSAELKFIEWGMDSVSGAVDKMTAALSTISSSVTRLYGPSDVAMTRGFTMGGSYLGGDTFRQCLNTGSTSGNPNAIMIKLDAIDKGVEEFTDTVVHEGTHKFLGTIDTGMQGSGLAWMKDDGLTNFKTMYPGVPTPLETPQFKAMSPTAALGNAYILTGYILYMPESEPAQYAEVVRQSKTSPLSSSTELGGVLRRALASRRPPDEP
jgi:hypothetical protein